MPTASTLEIVSTVGKLVTAISDVPALSALKPIGGLLVTICDHVEALESNKDAAITLVERVNRAVEVLTNRAQNLDGVVPGNYSDDIKSLEDVLVKIATALEKSRRRKWLDRVLFPKADTAKLNDLSSKLDYAIRMFGLAADFEARLTFQTLQAHFPKGGLELHDTAIKTSALRMHKEIDATDDCSVQVGTYDNQAVVVKKYYTAQEERFTQDLRQRRNLIHPGIACVIGSSKEASIMLLRAEGYD
ncbi:hypothetical protein FRC04_000742 [Tulasnella sp. 424]|nr:hypothetical protein FRC04_000742 [Tulasnella sp. 424]